MKRLIKNYKDSDIREHIIPTTPIYNPLGKGDFNSEFYKTDEKSYEKMMNKKHKEKFWTNGE